MRINLPVTQREYEFPDDLTLMSTTDTRSHIQYANAAFVEVSGFELDEITGQAHNLVRHPDMPPQAFADMWATLKGGESWSALVKNRRKNGDHYWVRANATPMVRDGQLVGYMSVRTKPGREEVAAAEQLYRDFREGRAGSRAFHKGIVVRTGMWRWRSLLRVMPVRWRIRCALLGLGAASVLGAAWLGLSGTALMGLAAGTGAATLAACHWLEGQVARPLQTILQQALRVAAGNPGENVALNRVDEIGMLLRAINQSGLNLRSLVDDVSEQITGTLHACHEIARGNENLSARAEQTAANLEQTASSMEQMTATVRHSADNARQSAQLADSASAVAGRGGQVMGQVVHTMQDITASSRRISDIIGVIDSIAFQTNILALNAAVEAARAGEQGRGFAVVASEVRNLASRSAEAAREIKGLIQASVDKVESGSRLVADAGATMDDIVSQVRRVADLIKEISAATSEQSIGIGQVSTAVGELDRVTQENAALVEESVAAGESVRQRAARLVQAVSVYKSSPTAGPGMPVPVATSPQQRVSAPPAARLARA